MIQHDDMDVDLSAVFIAQYKIPRSGNFQLYVPIPSRLQELTERRDSFRLLNLKPEIRCG